MKNIYALGKGDGEQASDLLRLFLAILVSICVMPQVVQAQIANPPDCSVNTAEIITFAELQAAPTPYTTPADSILCITRSDTAQYSTGDPGLQIGQGARMYLEPGARFDYSGSLGNGGIIQFDTDDVFGTATINVFGTTTCGLREGTPQSPLGVFEVAIAAPGFQRPFGSAGGFPLTVEDLDGNTVDIMTGAGNWANIGGVECPFGAPAAAPPVIDAQPEATTSFAGINDVLRILSNDTIDGNPATISNVDISVVTPATSIGGGPVPVLDPTNGTVDVPAGTPNGTYTITYEICEAGNGTNCDTTTATLTLQSAIFAIDQSRDNACVLNGGTLGTTNVYTDFDNGTFGVITGGVKSPATNPYDPALLEGDYRQYRPRAFNNEFAPPGYGQYSIVGNITVARNRFQHEGGITDPTNPDGRFFHADPDNAQAPTFIANLTGLNPFEEYEISFWVADAELGVGGGDPKNRIRVFADGSEIYDTGFITNQTRQTMIWTKHSVVAQAGASGTLELELRTTEAGRGGRDIHLDNIAVYACLPEIEAVDDPAQTFGVGGGDTTSVLDNDTLNEDPINRPEITLTPGTAPNVINGSITMDPTTGEITVAPNTTRGTYTYSYEICSVASPSVCDTATATVVVDYPSGTTIPTAPGPARPQVCTPSRYQSVTYQDTVGTFTFEAAAGDIAIQSGQVNPLVVTGNQSNGVIFRGSEFVTVNPVSNHAQVTLPSFNIPGTDRTFSQAFTSTAPRGVANVMDIYVHINSLDQLAFALDVAGNAGLTATVVSGSEDAGFTLGRTREVSDILEGDKDENAFDEALDGDAGLSADFTVRFFANTPGRPIDGLFLNFLEDPVRDVDNEQFQLATELCIALADIELIKTISSVDDTNGNGVVGDPGDTVNYAFRVENTGDLPLTDAAITDLDATLTGTLPDLASGAVDTASVTGTRIITPADQAAGFVQNSASVSANIQDDAGNPVTTSPPVTDISDTGTLPDLDGADDPVRIAAPEATESPDGNGVTDADPTNDPTVLNLSVADPSITLIKSLDRVEDTNGNGFTDDGDTAFYNFVVTNTGNTALADIIIEDALLVDPAVAPAPDALLPGETATLDNRPYILGPPDVVAGFVENSADVTGTPVATDAAGDPDPAAPLQAPGGGNLPDVTDVSDSGTQPDGSTVASPETTETADGSGNRDGDLTNDPTVLLIAPEASVSVVKSIASIDDTDGNDLINAGDFVNYTFVVTNTGNVVLNFVTLTDTIATVSTVGAPVSIGIGGTNTTSFTARYEVQPGDVSAGGVENTATVEGTAVDASGNVIADPDDPSQDLTATDISDSGTEPAVNGAGGFDTVTDPEANETEDLAGDTDGETDNDPTVLTIPNPSISLIKSVGSVADTNTNGLIGDGGDTINYVFEVRNTGTTDLTNVTIDDTALVNASGDVIVPDPVVNGGPIDLAIGAGDTLSFTASYIISAPDAASGALQNSADVTAEAVDGDGNTLRDLNGLPIDITDISDAGTQGNTEPVADPEATTTPVVDGVQDTDPANDPTVQTLVTNASPEVVLEKRIVGIRDTNASTFVDAGDTVEYAFTVRNTGNTRLSIATIDDPRIGTVAGGPIILEIGAENAVAFTGEAVISGAEFATGQIENTADVTATPVNAVGAPLPLPAVMDTSDTATAPDIGPTGVPATIPDPAGSGGPDDPTVLNFPRPEIELVKSLTTFADTNGSGQRDAGDTVTYTFAVTNTGNVDLVNLVVTDTSLPGVTISNGGAIASLDQGDTNTSLIATYTVRPIDVAAGAIENTADAVGDAVAADGTPINDPFDPGNPLQVTDTSDAGTDPDGDPIPTPGTTETPDADGDTDADPGNDPTVALISPNAEINLLKSITAVDDTNGSGLTDAGDTVTYGFVVMNIGNTGLEDVIIDDATVTLSGGPIDLAIGASDSTTFTATYVLTDADVTAGGVENTATAEGVAVNAAGDPIPDPLSPGSPIMATDVSDSGTGPEVDATGNVPAITDPQDTETPDLAGGTDGLTDNDPTVLIIPNPQISLIKSVSSVQDSNGDGLFGGEDDDVFYSFTVTNTGNADLEDLTITDSIVTVIGGPIDLAIGDTDTVTFTARYVVQPADISRGYIENTATANATAVNADGDPVFGPTGTPLTASDISDAGTRGQQVDVVPDPEAQETPDGTDDTNGDPTDDPTVQLLPANPLPELLLVKSITDVDDANGNGLVDVDDVITYSFRVTNTGNIRLADVTVTDSRATMSGAAITLEVGETDTTTFTGTTLVTAADVAGGRVLNTAEVTGLAVNSLGDPVNDPDTGLQLSADDTSDTGTEPRIGPSGVPPVVGDPAGEGTGDDPTVLLIENPSITIRKSVANVADTNGDNLFGGVDDIVTYSFLVTNTGNTALDNVFITDDVADVSGGPIDLPIGGSNGSAFTATHAITLAEVTDLRVVNTADVFGDALTPVGDPVRDPSGDPVTVTDVSDTGTDDAGDPVTNPEGTETTSTAANVPPADTDSGNDPTVIVVPTNPEPDLRLVKSVFGVADTDADAVTGGVDDVVTYQLEVFNTGNTDLSNVAVNDPLLGGVVGTIPFIAVGASDSVFGFYTVTIPDEVRGYIQNTATATGTGVNADGNPFLDGGGLPLTADDVSDTGTDRTAGTVPDAENTETPQGDDSTDSDPTNDPTVINVPLEPSRAGVSGIVFLDNDRNDDFADAIDDRLPDYRVVLRDGAGNIVDQTVSGPDGFYEMTGFAIGDDYVLEFLDPTSGSVIGRIPGLDFGRDTVLTDQNQPIVRRLASSVDGTLTLAKTTTATSVIVGQTVPYMITISNSRPIPVSRLDVTDRLPVGLTYVPGTAVIADTATEPTVTGNLLTFADVAVPASGSLVISLSAKVNTQAAPGALTNVANLLDGLTGERVAETVRATVYLRPEAVFDCSDVIGKVFDDRNLNGYQDPSVQQSDTVLSSRGITDQSIFAGKFSDTIAEQPLIGEPGLPGVRVVTQTGTIITTDEYGRFSVPCAELPGATGANFSLKIDERSLPTGYRLTTENPRTMRLTAGIMTELNFGASIGRVVNIDLTAAAFDSASVEPGDRLEAGLTRLLDQIADTPSVIRLSYFHNGEEQSAMRARLRAVEDMIEDHWADVGRYRLIVERTMKRLQ